MTAIFYGLLFFCCAFCLHLVIWRAALPKRHTDALLVIFFLSLVCGAAILKMRQGAIITGIPALEGLFAYLRLCLFYISLALAYIISYSAIEADSPSLTITLKIAAAGKNGLEKSEIDSLLTDEVLLFPRLDDLVRDGLAVLDSDRYRLTSKGKRFIGIFIFFRKLLGAAKGG